MRSTFFPAADWLARYRRPWLKADVLAGLTTAAVVIPKAMAYATIAGLPVEIGLYTALLPMVVYAALGTSRALSVSTTTTLAILCASALGEAAPRAEPAALVTAAATLALMVGAILVLARLFRLGFVANFISDPVLTGFKAGIGLVIVVDQVPKVFGIHIDKAGWFRDVAAIVRHLPETSIPTLAVGLATLAIVIGLEHFAPKLPSPLLAVGGGIAASAFLRLQASGVSIVGHIPSGLPAFVPPDLALLEPLWPAAVAMALMSFTETIAAGRAFTAAGEPRPDAEPGARRDRRRQPAGRPLRSHARRRRNVADSGEPQGRSAHAGRLPRDLGGDAGHPALPGAGDGPHTPGHAGGGGDRHLGGPHPPGGLPRDPPLPDP